jgi:glycosyltransferase involved in cell wall biosynthesis
MRLKNPINVAFLFNNDGNEWQGGKNYFRALFYALEYDTESDIRVIAYIGKQANSEDFNFPKSVLFRRSSTLDRFSFSWLFDQFCYKLFDHKPLLNFLLTQSDVKLISHCNPHFSSSIPTIAWIPDFQHVYLPQFFKRSDINSRNKQFNTILNRSDLVLVSSESALNDLSNFSPRNVKKARVLQFCSISPELSLNENEDLVSLYGLPEKFFYLPNQFWAHKNHQLVLEALALLRIQCPLVQIVCTGALSDYRSSSHIDYLMRRICELGLKDSFRLLGLIPHKHVPKLMLLSLGVINPSLFEGWSSTVEEAKTLGVPLLLSDLPVHREQTLNNDALFFDAYNCTDLLSKMLHVINGVWPNEKSKNTLSPIDRHKKRSLEFSRKYSEIVGDLFKK